MRGAEKDKKSGRRIIIVGKDEYRMEKFRVFKKCHWQRQEIQQVINKNEL